jgi:hypothetical protein
VVCSEGSAVVGAAVGGVTVPVPLLVAVKLAVAEVWFRLPVVLLPVPVPVGRTTPDEVVTPTPGERRVKLAHEMRVLLDRWKTTERLPT